MVRAVLVGLVTLGACGYQPLEPLCSETTSPDCFDPKADARASDGSTGNPDGSTGNPDSDGVCSVLHYLGLTRAPAIQLLIDRSASMNESLGAVTRWQALRDALVGPQGLVTTLEQQVQFGATLYSASTTTCPDVFGVARARNTRFAIDILLSNEPIGTTPTHLAIDSVVADFVARPSPPSNPPMILLVTDGLPNECGGSTPAQAPAVAAAQRAFASGIRLLLMSVGDTPGTASHFQDLANAGSGIRPGQPNAPYHPVTASAQIPGALRSIAGSTQSCDLELDHRVDPSAAPSGTVQLNNLPLTFGTNWALDASGLTIHLFGSACSMLQSSLISEVNASFACSAVHPR